MSRLVRLLARCVMLAAWCCAGATVAQAADAPACRLTRYSSLSISTQPDGRIAIPVAVEGHPSSFLVDTGGVSATMTPQLAEKLGRTPKPTNRWLQGVAGSLLTSFVYVDSFSIGRLTGNDLPVYIDPRIGGLGLDGTLAPDMMSRFDVDFDFAHGIVNLFSSDHCPGKVVYWTRSGYVVAPMDVAPNGHIRIPITINGKPAMAMLDTGATTSVMSLDTAKALGITPDDPDLKLKRSYGPNDQYKVYTYPFQTMDLEGVTVNNPHISVMSNEMLNGGLGKDVIVGIGIMRQLHLYIAYKERKLYITPAGAN